MRALACLLLSAVLLAGCTDNTATTTTPTATTTPATSTPATTTPTATTTVPTVTTPTSVPNATGSEPKRTTTVNITGFKFDPASIIVSKGWTTTWTNKDATTHTVTFDDGSHDSDNLTANQTHAYTFNNVGLVSYHCKIHPSIKGSVLVEANSTAPPPPVDTTPKSIEVQVSSFAYSPSTVTLPNGSTVTWRNTGGQQHTATGQGFDSGLLGFNQTYSYTFNKTGQFFVRCIFHQDMRGTITIT